MAITTKERNPVGYLRLIGRKLHVSLPPGFRLAGLRYVNARTGRVSVCNVTDGAVGLDSPMLDRALQDKPRRLISCAQPAPGWGGGPFARADRLGRVEAVEGLDPAVVGADGQLYNPVASVQYQTTATAYAASSTPAPLQLPKNTLITELLITADPIATSGAATNLAQDPGDKYLQAMSVAGGATYYQHSDSIGMAKHLGNLNKYVYGGAVPRLDFASGGSATQTPWNWRLHFGALNDYNPFDPTSGIPAEDETNLVWSVTFPANSVIAGSGQTISTSTNIYITVIGVNGMTKAYRDLMPIPDFRMDVISTVVTNSSLNLLTKRFLKRSTIVNMAAAANNDSARNDSNITDFSIQILKPTTIKLLDRVRAQVARSLLASWGGRWGAVDANGASAVAPAGLVGVYVIDWRKLTGNPYGLNLYRDGRGDTIQVGDVQYQWTMGTTTGQINIYHEYYAARSPESLALMEAWGKRAAFQPV